jgi:hypothetical protein
MEGGWIEGFREKMMMPLASGIQSRGNTGEETFVISVHNEGIDNGRRNTILLCFVKDALRRHLFVVAKIGICDESCKNHNISHEKIIKGV